MQRSIVVLASVLLFVQCSQSRAIDTRSRCFDYGISIQPILTAECGECHGEALAEGGFRTDSYDAVLATDEDGVARVAAGDASSLLLVHARGEDDHVHTAAAESVATLTRWVVDCRLSYLATDLLHPFGWTNPADDDFHGNELRHSGWDLASCEACHGAGDDVSGGASHRSCTACHQNGAGGCDTCHGDDTTEPWRGLSGNEDTDHVGVGAHRIHVHGGAVLGLSYACDECHVTPLDWRDEGHIFDGEGVADIDGRAEVKLGVLAAASVEGREDRRSGEPDYDGDTGACTNVYCHGGALADPKAPEWTVQDNANADCTLCHDEPPGGNSHAAGLAATDCVSCHAGVVDAASVLVDASLHLDARISLGDGSETCAACHGSGIDGAPPPALGGETTTNDPGVGAHQAHLGASVFAGPVACAACHVVPTGDSFLEAVGSPGHVDTAVPVEVFPDDPRLAAIATAENAVPGYDFSTTTCSDVYCHGGGELMSLDQAAGIVRSPRWADVGTGTIVCGSCHGVPMTVGTGHIASLAITDCVICHATVIDDTGALIFDGDGNTRHVNGQPDFNQ